MKDSILVNYYTINGNDYIIVKEIDHNNKHYVFLVNEKDEKDILIKILKDDMLYSLESEAEFYEMLKILTQ